MLTRIFHSVFAGVFLLLLSFPLSRADGEVEQGFELSRERCSRCHVIGEYNRMGGIGNSPSFTWMVKSDDWRERFLTFYSRRPHPVFARVSGYPLWSNVDPYYPPFEITLDEIDLIAAYVETLREPH
ncbi:MAG TPA: hypothetical protein DG761_08795 [Gammaproteobacteria bacterium]|jgi:mono/diheme cytochrome c family protein|nr:hypothetical protein [Acidiferrobacteraceae bacterium]MDP6552308.1 cytochrome c [Arenicellales bacterium]MDP6790405.1 cytochrome c [Arenicellales bacterium]MDP6919574.1 cytochrome c [Arenicellales bacterium]HCX88110.1 hypothetical protein [Gammaproteobacteria bacterium]|tara:strand:+ start:1842 stop:2222 length:381 start_codon:yes stop_codon:yes gene_type:complete